MKADPQRGFDLHRSLHERFGFIDFRPGQTDAVQCEIDGHDAIVVMPTGSGKSLCFQLPALELPGTTIVVSPLIALMKDQVDQLTARGVRAVAIHSGVAANERRRRKKPLPPARPNSSTPRRSEYPTRSSGATAPTAH